MPSPIGDILNNPAVRKKREDEDPSLLARLLNSGIKGAAWLPDAVLNNFPKGAHYWGDALLNRFVDDENKDILERTYEEKVARGEAPNDSIENALKAIGAIRDLPTADTKPEQIAESLGTGVGSYIGGSALAKGLGVPIGKFLLGTDAPFSSAILNPVAANTVGGTVAQGVAQPYIADAFPNSPKTQMALNILAGILGGYGSGAAAKAVLPGTEKILPSMTAGQRSAVENGLDAERTKDLLAKQLDLAKKDPKTSDLLKQIGNNQEQEINSLLRTENPISGKNLASHIEGKFKDLKAQRAKEYQEEFQKLIDAHGGKPIPVDKTMALIHEMSKKSAIGSPLMKALKESEKLVSNNSGSFSASENILRELNIDDLLGKSNSDINDIAVSLMKKKDGDIPTDINQAERLIDAKRTIQDMTEPTSGLNLGSKQSARLQTIAAKLNSEIEDALPGYLDMNARYKSQTENLENLLGSVTGKSAVEAGKKPGNIIRNIFEKTDPENADHIKSLMDPEIHSIAASTYLNDVARRGLKVPEIPGTNEYNPAIPEASKNVYNQSNRYNRIADILQNNRRSLETTLPDEQRRRMAEALNKIAISNLGRPRNNYVLGARREFAAGDEVKGLGMGNLIKDALMWVPRKAGLNYLNRQEMLTGVTPARQIGNAVAGEIPGLGQKTMVADAITDQNQAPQQPQAQMMQAPQAESAEPLQINQPPSFKDWSSGVVQPTAPQGQAPQAPESAVSTNQPDEPKAPISFKEFMYGTSQTPGAAGTSKAGTRESDAKAYREYIRNKRMRASKGALDGNSSNLIEQVKEAAIRAFPDNPTMQKVAISQAILESGLNGNPSQLAVKNKNLFGIKEGRTAPGSAGSVSYNTQEYRNGRPGNENARFSANNSYDESLEQYRNLLENLPRYSRVINSRDPSEAFIELQRAGYATDPQYARKLINIYNRSVAPLFTDI